MEASEGVKSGTKGGGRGFHEARISRHEIAATRENLRGLIMGRGWLGSQDSAVEKERKREQVRDVRWAAPQGRASEAPY